MNNNKEILGLHRITKKHLKELCKKHRLYQTPHLNDQLYLHFQGFQAIENLEEYTGLKCLWLESNAISEIQGLDCQTELKCLFLQNNLIKKIENLHCCSELDTLNLASNHITKIENCGIDVLPVLSTLNLSRNYLRNSGGLQELVNCKSLWSLDLSHNRIDDILVVKIFASMPELRVLVLQGNPVVSRVPQYRKTLILECKNLTYLDSRPVFPKDRACAEAWKRGGYEEERREHDRWIKMDRKKIRDSVNATLRLRIKHGDGDVQLLESTDEEEEIRQPKKLRKIPEESVSADLEITGMANIGNINQKKDAGDAGGHRMEREENGNENLKSSATSMETTFTSIDTSHLNNDSDNEGNSLNLTEKIEEKNEGTSHKPGEKQQTDPKETVGKEDAKLQEDDILNIIRQPDGMEEAKLQEYKVLSIPSQSNYTDEAYNLNPAVDENEGDDLMQGQRNVDKPGSTFKPDEELRANEKADLPKSPQRDSVIMRSESVFSTRHTACYKSSASSTTTSESSLSSDSSSNEADMSDDEEDEMELSYRGVNILETNVEGEGFREVELLLDERKEDAFINVEQESGKGEKYGDYKDVDAELDEKRVEEDEENFKNVQLVTDGKPVQAEEEENFKDVQLVTDGKPVQAEEEKDFKKVELVADRKAVQGEEKENLKEFEMVPHKKSIQEEEDIQIQGAGTTDMENYTEREVFANGEEKANSSTYDVKLTSSGTFDIFSMKSHRNDFISESQMVKSATFDIKQSFKEEKVDVEVFPESGQNSKEGLVGEGLSSSDELAVLKGSNDSNLLFQESLSQSLDLSTSTRSFNKFDNSKTHSLDDDETLKDIQPLKDKETVTDIQPRSDLETFKEPQPKSKRFLETVFGEEFDTDFSQNVELSDEEDSGLYNSFHTASFNSGFESLNQTASEEATLEGSSHLEGKSECVDKEEIEERVAQGSEACLSTSTEEDIVINEERVKLLEDPEVASWLQAFLMRIKEKEEEKAAKLQEDEYGVLDYLTKNEENLPSADKVEVGVSTTTQSKVDLSSKVGNFGSNFDADGSKEKNEGNEPEKAINDRTSRKKDDERVAIQSEADSSKPIKGERSLKKEGEAEDLEEDKPKRKEDSDELQSEPFHLQIIEKAKADKPREKADKKAVENQGDAPYKSVGEIDEEQDVRNLGESLYKCVEEMDEDQLRTDGKTVVGNPADCSDKTTEDMDEDQLKKTDKGVILKSEELEKYQSRKMIDKTDDLQSYVTQFKSIEGPEKQSRNIEDMTASLKSETAFSKLVEDSVEDEPEKKEEKSVVLQSYAGQSTFPEKPKNQEDKTGFIQFEGVCSKSGEDEPRNKECKTPVFQSYAAQSESAQEPVEESGNRVGEATFLQPKADPHNRFEESKEDKHFLEQDEEKTLLKRTQGPAWLLDILESLRRKDDDNIIPQPRDDSQTELETLRSNLSFVQSDIQKSLHENEALEKKAVALSCPKGRFITPEEGMVTKLGECSPEEERYCSKNDNKEDHEGYSPFSPSSVQGLDETIKNKEEDSEEESKRYATMKTTNDVTNPRTKDESSKKTHSQPSTWWEQTLAEALQKKNQTRTTSPEEALPSSDDDNTHTPPPETVVHSENQTLQDKAEAFSLLESILTETRKKIVKEVVPQTVALKEPPPPNQDTLSVHSSTEKSSGEDDSSTRENPMAHLVMSSSTIREVLTSFNEVMETIAKRNQERSERIKALNVSPSANEFSAQSGDHVNPQATKPTAKTNQERFKTLTANPLTKEISTQSGDDINRQVMEPNANTNQERSERIKDLIANPLTKEFSTQSGDDINRQFVEMKQQQRERISQLVDRVYAQKDKYDDTLEVVDGRLMVVKRSTGALEELPPPPTSKYTSCGVCTNLTASNCNDSDSDAYGTALSEAEDGGGGGAYTEQHASDTKIKRIPHVSASSSPGARGNESDSSSSTSPERGEENSREYTERPFESQQKVQTLHSKLDAEVFSEVNKWMEEGIEFPIVKPTIKKKRGKEEEMLLRKVLGETSELQADLECDVQSFMDTDEATLEDIVPIFEITPPTQSKE